MGGGTGSSGGSESCMASLMGSGMSMKGIWMSSCCCSSSANAMHENTVAMKARAKYILEDLILLFCLFTRFSSDIL